MKQIGVLLLLVISCSALAEVGGAGGHSRFCRVILPELARNAEIEQVVDELTRRLAMMGNSIKDRPDGISIEELLAHAHQFQGYDYIRERTRRLEELLKKHRETAARTQRDSEIEKYATQLESQLRHDGVSLGEAPLSSGGTDSVKHLIDLAVLKYGMTREHWPSSLRDLVKLTNYSANDVPASP